MNQNNDLGLPATILSMPQGTEFLVLEMGMSAPGEIARLAELSTPHIGIVTSVQPSHLRTMKSRDAIARAKGELIASVARTGEVAIVPEGESYLLKLAEDAPRHRLFGMGPDASARVLSSQTFAWGTAATLRVSGQDLDVKTPLLGKEQALNMSAAAAAALEAGASLQDVVEGLEQTPRCPQRCYPFRIGRSLCLDDTYSSNPASAKSALQTLASVSAGLPATAVLGAMAELGPASAAFHRSLGARVARCGIAELVLVGAERVLAIEEGALEAGMDGAVIHIVATPEDAADLVAAQVGPRVVLFKASREIVLERAVSHLVGLASTTELRL